MASITAQRDLVISLKRETLLNVGILSKLQPMPCELSRQVFKDNALEKPTQSVFYNLAYYLVSIIDPSASAALPWPLYDSKAERMYRNELSLFISDYSAKELLSPVMSSYLVNPGCYKVTVLIFQMSQLAVQKVLVSKMHKDQQKKLYNEMTEQYKTHKEKSFIDGIEKETEIMLSKFSNYLNKREALEKVAGLFREAISRIEATLTCSGAQEYINKLVDGFLKEHRVNKEMRNQLLKLKNVSEKPQVFDDWLSELDSQIESMKTEWESKMSPFLSICQETVQNSEALIARHTGKADRKTFAIEYCHKTDEICTKELQSLVNSQQRYILKNVVVNERLNFPNLIRGFLIAICFTQKNIDVEIDSNIHVFNKYLEGGRRNYSEVVEVMKRLVQQVMNAESRLLPPSDKFNMTSASLQELAVIPPLPDLSDLKINKQFHPQIAYDAFTPLNLTKHQFNLERKMSNNNSFTKPLPKMSLITPFHHKSNRDDFLGGVALCHTSGYDQQNMSMNIHNMSTISHVSKVNETVAECPGFTQQQIFRLLSTRKSTSTKKFKHKSFRPNINVIKGGLFNESASSNETFGLYRSYSSPNLLDHGERRPMARNRARKLSIMKEGSPSALEVSGIAVLDRDSNHSTPQGQDHISLEGVHKLDAQNQTVPTATPTNNSFNSVSATSTYSTNEKEDLNKEIRNVTLEEMSTVLSPHNKIENIQIPQWKGMNSIQTEDNNIIAQHRSSENIQRENKITENIHKLRKSQIPRKTTDKLYLYHKSIENIQKECTEGKQKNHKSTDNVQNELSYTQNIQNGDISLVNFKKEFKHTENLQNGGCIEKLCETSEEEHTNISITKEEPNVLTPQPKQPLIKKTSSIEKIINRFKKVRASVLPDINLASTEDPGEFNTIVEEKENIDTTKSTFSVDMFTANRVLLPDLLSPSCSSILTQKCENFLENGFDSDEEVTLKPRRARESLGATLGVDHTFLDQFDLVD